MKPHQNAPPPTRNSGNFGDIGSMKAFPITFRQKMYCYKTFFPVFRPFINQYRCLIFVKVIDCPACFNSLWYFLIMSTVNTELDGSRINLSNAVKRPGNLVATKMILSNNLKLIVSLCFRPLQYSTIQTKFHAVPLVFSI